MTPANSATSLDASLTLRRHEGINRIYDSVFAADDLCKKLKIICDGVVSTFEADFCRIWMIRQGDQCDSGCPHAVSPDERHLCRFRDLCLHLVASSGRYTHLDGFHGRVPYGCYKIGRIASGEMPTFLTNDVTHDMRVHDHEWAEKHGLVAFSGYQLRDHQGQVNGVLACFSRHTISSEEHAILENLANSTAHVIQVDLQRFKLETLARQQTRNLEKLLAFSQSLCSSRDIASLYQRITSLTRDLLGLDFSTLMLLSEDRKSLAVRDTIGFDQFMTGPFDVSDDQGLFTFVVQKKTAATVVDFTTENRFKIPSVIKEKKITSALCVPMMLGDDVLGVMIGHSLEKRIFSAAEISLYQSFANQAAMAVKNKLRMQALQLSEEKLRTMIETLPIPLFYKNVEGVYLDCNVAFAEFLGKPKEQIINATADELFPGELADVFRQADINLLKSKKKQIYETQIMSADDTLHDVLFHKATWCNQAGIAQGLVGIMLDITMRKQAEKELAAEKERLAVTLKSIGDGVITTDTNGNIVLINRVAENITGWSQAEAAGRPLNEIFEIIHEKNRQLCESPVHNVLEHGEILGLENHRVLITRDGTEVSIADSGAPIRSRDDEIIGVVLVFRDITNQLKTEEELLKIKKLESVGVLAGGIAHDFNNILAAILGNINLARHLLDPGDEVCSMLEEAEKATLRARDLTQQLLTFSKGGDPVKKIASLPKLIRDSAEFILRGSPVVCHYNIADDLWLVDIDTGQMSQVIQNLILNARKAIPDSGRITISYENISDIAAEEVLSLAEGDYVKMTIEDSGVGIPANIIDKIFDPYFSTSDKGSGLGLAITHSIINKHDGLISVESEPGQGATFTIFLPATLDVRKRREKKSLPFSHGKGRVMIMDDEKMVRDVAGHLLEHLGYDVVFAEDGDEAVNLYGSLQDTAEPVDIIIMDLTIPGGMGGKKAVREILRLDAKAKVIVASGYSNDPIMALCQNYGFRAAVAKPFTLSTLAQTIQVVMSSD